MRCRISVRPFALLLAAVILAAASARDTAAQAYKAEAFSAPPPQELAAAVRDALGSDAVRVAGPKGALCEIWWRKAVPAQAGANQGLGIAYGQLAEGTLVGAMRFVNQASDYRSQKIQPGVYTLRYALIPVDGNHQGVAPNRDFLLLSPGAADASPATIPAKELIGLSRKASGTGHPSVWSLTGSDSAPVPLPALEPTGDNWVLYFRAKLQQEDGTVAPLVMALVVVGHAPEA